MAAENTNGLPPPPKKIPDPTQALLTGHANLKAQPTTNALKRILKYLSRYMKIDLCDGMVFFGLM
jgi:hypothetical protein